MNKSVKIPAFLALLLLVSFHAPSQISSVIPPDTVAIHFLQRHPAINQQMIFVQTDNWLYSAGDSIWFAAYCLDEFSFKPDLQNVALFVDLVNDRDSVVSQRLLNNRYLRNNGNIILPESLDEGDYWLRAYTRNLLRTDSNKIFVKNIYVINPKKQKPPGRIKAKGDSIKGQVFPEFGSFIAGSSQSAAVYMSDQQGNPIPGAGYITGVIGLAEDSFKIGDNGWGKFNLLWKRGNNYTVHLHSVQGRNLQLALSVPDPFAVGLTTLSESDTSFRMKVLLGDSVSGPGTIHYIFGTQSNEPLFCISGRGEYEAEISKKFFPTGESIILLLDQQLGVAYEKHLYRRGQGFTISLSADKNNYSPREKVKLEMTLSDSNHQPLGAICSISVTDNRFSRELPIEDTVSFQDSSAMGLLMLGQNFHRPVLNKNDDENDFVGIRGTLRNKKGEPMKNQIVTLFGAQQEFLFGADTSDELGRFHFPFYYSQDSFSFQLQVTNLKGKTQDPDIILDSFHFPMLTTPPLLKRKFTAKGSLLIDTFRAQIIDTFTYPGGKGWLTPVTVTRAKKRQLSYDENKRVSMFSTVITPDMIQPTGLNPVGDAVTMAHGVHFINGIINIGTAMSNLAEPLLIVDGAYIDSNAMPPGFGGSPLLNYLRHIPAQLIDFIEIVRPPQSAYYGARGANGAIIINTRNTGGLHQSLVTVPVFHARGFSGSPSYSGPDYDNPAIKKSPYPDTRSTIYWNGRIITDEHGRAEIEFFTSDGPATYTVRVRGVTINGDIIDRKIKIHCESN